MRLQVMDGDPSGVLGQVLALSETASEIGLARYPRVPRCQRVAVFKTQLSFHSTGWLLGIPLLGYLNP